MRNYNDLSECEAVVNKYNKYLKNLQNGKNLTEVCIDRDYGSIPLNLFHDLCETLNKDEEFDFMKEGDFL